jgi:hypothetical protein
MSPLIEEARRRVRRRRIAVGAVVVALAAAAVAWQHELGRSPGPTQAAQHRVSVDGQPVRFRISRGPQGALTLRLAQRR